MWNDDHVMCSAQEVGKGTDEARQQSVVRSKAYRERKKAASKATDAPSSYVSVSDLC